MPKVRFLATRDGATATSLPPTNLAPEQTSLEGLRSAFFEGTGQHAFVLHDDGLGLGLEKEQYLVRLEGDVPGAKSKYPTLARARAWQQPGWFGETLGWLERTLGETVLTVEQVSSNDLACVLRVTTEGKTVYLKASETGLEAALSAHLAARYPELIPEVLAWDKGRQLLVTKDCGARLSESADLDAWHAAVTRLVHFQWTADMQVFESQCPVYTFSDLSDRAEIFLRNADTLRGWGLTAGQVAALAERVPYIRRAHSRVLALGLPLLPAHGDAHPMNALSGCGVVWFDLSEACVAQPLLDIGWFLAWFSHPARRTLPLRRIYPDAATRLWDGYLHSYLQASGLPKAADLNDVVVLALTHRALVYHERFQTWRGTVSGWRPQYVPYYLRCLLKLPL